MKKVRNIRWYTVLIDTLKTETSNFILNPSLHWKPVECSQQCCCTCMPGVTKDKSGCMILYALKLIQFVVRSFGIFDCYEAGFMTVFCVTGRMSLFTLHLDYCGYVCSLYSAVVYRKYVCTVFQGTLGHKECGWIHIHCA